MHRFILLDVTVINCSDCLENKWCKNVFHNIKLHHKRYISGVTQHLKKIVHVVGSVMVWGFFAALGPG